MQEARGERGLRIGTGSIAKSTYLIVLSSLSHKAEIVDGASGACRMLLKVRKYL